ncbi:MAG: hypothetical protein AAB618_01720 [Patescibacteria group bacterium]
MATQYRHDSGPLIVEPILSKICWKEYDHERRDFDYSNLSQTIIFLKSGGARAHRQDYSEAATFALKQLKVPESEWTVIRALASEYFKQVKEALVTKPLLDKHWLVSVEENTREVTLFHHPTQTKSESFFSSQGFQLGSVTVEGRPCRNQHHIEMHQNKGTEVVYSILSGS